MLNTLKDLASLPAGTRLKDCHTGIVYTVAELTPVAIDVVRHADRQDELQNFLSRFDIQERETSGNRTASL